MTAYDDGFLTRIARRLALLRVVPCEILAEIVARDGVCMQVSAMQVSGGARPPRWRDAEKVPAADIPARLRNLAQDWAPYRTLTGRDIRHYLHTEHAIKVATTGHKYPVDPAAVRDALASRAAASGPDGAE